MRSTAQGLTDMSHSKQAQMQNLPLGATRWTGGFWGDRFQMLSTTGIWDMWDTWNTPWETLDADGKHGSNGFRNFEVAAGTVKGKHHGPPFHDGDMYKWLEACAAVYVITKDPKVDALMDKFIEQVALAQRADGYIHTPVVISERNQGIDSHAAGENAAGIEIGKDQKHAFASRLNFETYNLGHLMTAGIIHKRATGKTTLFDCGKKAADFLYNFLTNDAAELSRNAICPSHYMGAAEMYRETGDEKYLTLAKGLIAIRDSVTNGEDHNQDRHKFRDQYEAMGHAVRANYLYAGVADLYAETGEAQLLKNLTAIWDDIVNHKIYIMGGCGALYDGVSPDGTTYDQPSIQQIHQAYGRQFQLPQEAAHNEICAQIGMMLFAGVYMVFQLPNLILNAGLSLPAAAAILAAWILTMIFSKLIAVFLYTVSSTHPSLKSKVRIGVYLVLGALVGGFLIFWKSGNDGWYDALKSFFNAPVTRLIPIWGWIKGFVMYTAEGDYLFAGILFLLTLVFGGLMLFLIWRVKADFYEDAWPGRRRRRP